MKSYRRSLYIFRVKLNSMLKERLFKLLNHLKHYGRPIRIFVDKEKIVANEITNPRNLRPIAIKSCRCSSSYERKASCVCDGVSCYVQHLEASAPQFINTHTMVKFRTRRTVGSLSIMGCSTFRKCQICIPKNLSHLHLGRSPRTLNNSSSTLFFVFS